MNEKPKEPITTAPKRRRRKKTAQKDPVDQQIKSLADSIINGDEGDDEHVESPIKEKRKGSRKGKRHIPRRFIEEPQPAKLPTEKQPLQPIILTKGTSPRSPVIIEKSEREVSLFLNNQFGSADGDYTVLGDGVQTRTVKGKRKRLKTVLVEDRNNFRYIIYFDLTKISLVGGLISF